MNEYEISHKTAKREEAEEKENVSVLNFLKQLYNEGFMDHCTSKRQKKKKRN